MDRIDEAVGVALKEWYRDKYPYAPEAMRAALLAGMKVLLGEPVAWQSRFNHPLPNGGMCEWHEVTKECADTLPRLSYDVRPVYAPSLGEGDGR